MSSVNNVPLNRPQLDDVQPSAIEERRGAIDISAGFTNVYEISTDLKNVENIQNGEVAQLPEGKAKSLIGKIAAGILFAAGIALAAAAIIATAGVGGVVGAAAAAVTATFSGAGTTAMMSILAGVAGIATLTLTSDSSEDLQTFIQNARNVQNEEQELDLENKNFSMDDLNKSFETHLAEQKNVIMP